jgi:inositol transporter-like SP family MFS transporter
MDSKLNNRNSSINMMSDKNIDLSKWDNEKVNKNVYIWIIGSSLADFMDAYSFVSAGLVIQLLSIAFGKLSSIIEGLIPFSLSFGVFFGAFFGGKLGDIRGRKWVYSWDMILYAIASLLAGLSVNIIMFLIAFFFMGVALGIDVPVSWTLIAEIVPKNFRQRGLTIAYILWILAIPVTYTVVLGIDSLNLGSLSFRVLMWTITLMSLIVFAIRRKIVESPRWLAIKNKEIISLATAKIKTFRDFLKYYRKYFIAVMILYIAWGLLASTFGTFTSFIFPGLGFKSFLSITLVNWAILTVDIIATYFWAPISDKISRRLAFSISGPLFIVGMIIVVIASFIVNPLLGLIGLLIFGGFASASSPTIRTWSVESWPAQLRSTIQGQIWSYMRLASALWLFVVPTLLSAIGTSGVLVIVLVFALITVITGIFFMIPNTNKESLEEIENKIILSKEKEAIKK